MTEPIKIGDVELQGTEASEPVVFGGERMQVRHKFAGGMQTVQDFGHFPVETILVGGVMFGEFAEVRSQTLKQLMTTLAETKLTWSREKYTGVVHAYRSTVHHKNKIEFEIEFWPLYDETKPLPVQSDTTDFNSALGKSLANAEKMWQALFDQQPTTINFPKEVGEQWQRTMDRLAKFQKSNLQNNSKDIPPLIKLSFAGLLSDLIRNIAPIRFSTNGPAAYQASQATNILLVLRNIFTAPPRRYQTLPVSDPNLPQLAAQYYGDASLWTVIAEANDLGNQTNPKGDFLLKIPVDVGAGT